MEKQHCNVGIVVLCEVHLLQLHVLLSFNKLK